VTKPQFSPAPPDADPHKADAPVGGGNSTVVAPDETPTTSKKKEAPSSRTRFLVGGSGAEMPSYYNYVFAQRKTERGQ